MTRYRWVDVEKAKGDYPTSVLCDTAEVTRQGYYQWKGRGLTPNQEFNVELMVVIKQIYAELDSDYGVPMMTKGLRRRGYLVNHKRVARLMRRLGIQGCYKPRKVRTTIPSEDCPPIPDRLKRRFKTRRPNVAWVSDITYIPTGQGWLYLATVLDLGSRRLLGYSMANHMRTSLIEDALNMAVTARGGEAERTIFHSDRGNQFMSANFQKLVKSHGMKQSVGRTGVCWDNSVAESFFATLKRELISKYRCPDHATARRAIFSWVNRYNNQRLHSSLGYIPPAEWENKYNKNKTTTAAQKAA